MALTFVWLKATRDPITFTSLRNRAYATKWPCASRPATFAGGQGHIYLTFGIWNDNMIFQDEFVHFVEAGERCEMDDGYRGSAPLYAKCPGVIEANPDPDKAEMQQRVRNHRDS